MLYSLLPRVVSPAYFLRKGGFDMEKEKALEIAIELAKIAAGSSSSNLSVYPSKDARNSVADFIETLMNRLTAM